MLAKDVEQRKGKVEKYVSASNETPRHINMFATSMERKKTSVCSLHSSASLGDADIRRLAVAVPTSVEKKLRKARNIVASAEPIARHAAYTTSTQK